MADLNKIGLEEVNDNRPNSVYLVWQGGEDEQYFNQYFSLKDAVTSENEGAVIFLAKLKSLGAFKVKVVTKLVRKSKKKSKKKSTKKVG